MSSKTYNHSTAPAVIKQTNKQTNKLINKQTNKSTDKPTDKSTDKLIDISTKKSINKSDTKKSKQTNKNITKTSNTKKSTLTHISSTSVLPTSVLPTSVLPTSVLPTSILPTSVLPTSILPTSVLPVLPTATTSLIGISTNSLGEQSIGQMTYSWDSFMDEINSTDPFIISDVLQIRSNNIEDAPAPTLKNGKDLTLDSIDFEMNTKNPSSNNLYNGLCHCGGQIYNNKGILVCQQCGIELQNTSCVIEEEEYSVSAVTDCNVNSNGFIAVKMIGKGSYGYQRSLLKTCANYSKYRKINTLKDMNNWNNTSKKQHIPKNVIQEANDMFAKIKEKGYVFRKDGKIGVLSACLYYACYNNGISKTPSEIAQFSGIEERFHSQGDRILHDLNERGIIDIPLKVNPIVDYIDRYMELLDISKRYKQFVIDIIARAEKKHIHIIHDSKSNTKAIGAIYMLVERIPELRKRITKDMIEKDCGISKTTFIRYYNILYKYYKKLKKIFKIHQIPMPIEWKNTVD
jgi:transcription initiation factor TFIIIB Brf1 subunit/transcription initiation factor TFIIB